MIFLLKNSKNMKENSQKLIDNIIQTLFNIDKHLIDINYKNNDLKMFYIIYYFLCYFRLFFIRK